MKQFELNIKDFISLDSLSFSYINTAYELEKHIDNMYLLINYFNIEYKWNGMFKIEDVYKRIEKGDNLFLMYFNNNPIGYVWFTQRNEETCYLYNLYVTNSIKRPKNAPKWFINKTCSFMSSYYSKIICECEDWHIAAQNIFISNGFIDITN